MVSSVAGCSQNKFLSLLHNPSCEGLSRRLFGLRVGWGLRLLLCRLVRLGNRSVSRGQGLRCRLRLLQARPRYQFTSLECVLGSLGIGWWLLSEPVRNRRENKTGKKIRPSIHRSYSRKTSNRKPDGHSEQLSCTSITCQVAHFTRLL